MTEAQANHILTLLFFISWMMIHLWLTFNKPKKDQQIQIAFGCLLVVGSVWMAAMIVTRLFVYGL
jgi:hypothetical protein